MAKRRASQELEADADEPPANMISITPLGAGQEVGRSCVTLHYQGKRIMFDCGIHPGKSGMDALPFLDEEELDKVDAALITHFHLDHCAAVPYLIGRTNFKGRLIMTHPTKAIMYTLLRDFLRMAQGGADEQLYGEEDLEKAMARAEVLDFDQTLDLGDGVKVTPYRAGHVLGAAMFLVDIGGMRCLYTGDYSRITDRHLDAADIPPERPHVVIVESTYGVSRHLPRDAREKRFLQKITETVLRGGKVLLPIVALGRAQELLLMLDEHWERSPQLRGIPIMQASGLAKKALSVFQTYIEMMNDDIKRLFAMRNPFSFRHVEVVRGAQRVLDESGPCIVMATPSMLQNGLSRDLFEMWCQDSRNLVMICDFAVQGTLAREIQSNVKEVMTREGHKVPMRCQVEVLSFSAHADYEQTSGFLDTLQPPHVVLVHGEAGEMLRLKLALQKSAKERGWQRSVYDPKVTTPVEISFTPQQVAQLVGRLAEKPPAAGQVLRGVLVQGRSGHTLMAPEDLPIFTKLRTGRVVHKQAIPVDKSFTELRLALEIMFEGIEGAGHLPVSSLPGQPSPSAAEQRSSGETSTSAPGEQAVCVGEIVTVRHRPANPAAGYGGHVVVEWQGGSIGDIVADAVIAVILQSAGEPAGAAQAEEARRQALAGGDLEAAMQAEMALAAAVLRAQFGPCVEVHAEEGTMRMELDGQQVVVEHKTGKVHCGDTALAARIERALQRVAEAMRPCGLDFED